MSPLFRRSLVWILGLGALVFWVFMLPGTVSIWLDEHGHPVLTNRLSPPDPGSVLLTPEDLAVTWGGQRIGEPLETTVRSSSIREEDRFHRELLAARDDIRRGELRTGLRALRRLHSAHPGRPEPAWLLAVVERRRGRLEPALDALDSALRVASFMSDEWRATLEGLKGEIDAELAHAGSAYVEGSPIEVEASEHFRISYDHHFAGRDFGERVLEMLGRARSRLEEVLGRALGRPLEVRLYTKAHYLDSYQHRFGFATVGFYDGAIHVVSGRQPRDELLALLVHEYAHAIFEEALGGHQPFFLNEGIADREEERMRGRDRLSRSEWRQLLDAHRGDQWIPLNSLIRGFGGLKGKRALRAYLQSRGVIEMLETKFPGFVARWLDRCRNAEQWEAALIAETGWNTNQLDAELIKEVEARFPKDPLSLAEVGGTDGP